MVESKEVLEALRRAVDKAEAAHDEALIASSAASVAAAEATRLAKIAHKRVRATRAAFARAAREYRAAVEGGMPKEEV